MNFEQPPSPQAEGAQHEVPSDFFAPNLSSVDRLMERILDMHNQGLILQGSAQAYDAPLLAKAVYSALDELNVAFGKNQYQSEEEISSFFASKGITSAGGLRQALTTAVIRGNDDATVRGKIGEDGRLIQYSPKFPGINRYQGYFRAYDVITGAPTYDRP